MKTLKKTLCLVLAMVMVFGLCAVSASAKLGYGDTDDITYKEAVDVMSGIGILSGDARGFRPTDSITRAEAAKIIAYIKIGNAKQADALKATSDPFVDVPASHWAAGYIQYCVTDGIIAGKGDGYHPSDNVTGLEFAKMLLCALGYGKQGEFVGSDWSINTSKQALRLGIFDGNMGGASLDPATREECALYAFNAITDVSKVTYSSLLGNYIVAGDNTLGFASDANKEATFADDFKLKKSDNEDGIDAFGRPEGHYWYINTGKKEAITAKYGNDDNLKKVYTTAVTGGDIYSLLGKDAIDDCSEVVLYVDGDDEYSSSPDEGEVAVAKAAFEKGKTETLEGTGNGVETYVYQWWSGTDKDISNIKICIVNTYLAKVDDINEATSKKDREIELKLVDTTDAGNVDATLTYTTDEFDDGDYVLINISNPGDSTDGAVETVVPAPVLKTEVSRVTRKGDNVTLVADGTTYATAKKTADDGTIRAANKDNITNKMVDGKDHSLYIDNHGYVISVANVTTASDYVYVAAFGYKNNAGNDLTDKGVFQADIYYADGSHKIVAIDSEHTADGGDASAEGENYFYDKTATDKDEADALNKGKSDDATGLYKLDTYKGKAILTKENTATGSGQFISKNINNSISTKKMDSKTVFFYVSGEYGKDSWSVVTYTGIGNVPVGKSGETDVAEYLYDDDDVKAVAVDSVDGDEEGKVIYLYLGTEEDYSKGGADRNEVTYNFWKDGKLDAQTIPYKDSDAADDAIEDAETGFVTVSTKGEITNPDADGEKKYIVSNKVGYIYDATVSGDTTTATFTWTDGTIDLGIAGLKPVDLIDSGITTLKALMADDNTGYKVAVVFNETGNQATAIYIVGKPAA